MGEEKLNGDDCSRAEAGNLLNTVQGRANGKPIGPYEKVFKKRNSILTDLCKDNHGSTIYNIFVVITIYLVLINVLYGWRDNHEISFGFADLAEKFRGLEYGILVWLFVMMLTFLIFPIFRVWSKLSKRTQLKKLTGGVFILFYMAYLATIHSSVVFTCIHFDLSVVTTFTVLLEIIRLSMKSYAYIRSNAARVMAQKDFISPTIGQFVYFLFCPTLLYRDSYVRSSKRDWKKVLKYLIEFLTVAYSMSLANNCFLQRSVVDYGKTEVTIVGLLVKWIEVTLVVTVLFYFYGFYGLQHAWMNMFAELLRFGDRMLYRDWWNVKSMREFYRRWSLLVHEWLYEYVFADFYNYVTRKSITMSALVTIILSAIIHEYVLSVALRFFVPALLLLYLSFGVVNMYIVLNQRVGNTFVWFSLIIGQSLLVLLYSMEYYARINCSAGQNANDTLAYYYTPMTVKCNNTGF